MRFVLRFAACILWVYPPCSGIAVADDDPNVIESFEVTKNRGHLSIPVQFGGQDYRFILDTGFSFNLVHSDLKGALVPTGEKVLIDRSGPFDVYRSPGLTVGRAKLALQGRATVDDMSGFRELLEQEVHGILGMQFLRGRVVQIDYDSGRVSFLRNSTAVVGQRVSIYFTADGRPAVELDLPKVGRTPFVIDTGMGGWSSGALNTMLFDALAKDDQLAVLGGTNHLIVFGGEIEHRSGMLAWQDLYGNRHAKVLYDEGAQNALGVGCLARFKITFDFTRSVMVIEKGARYDWSTPVSKSGIDVSSVGGKLTIDHVEIGSAGWRCGIRTGDQIMKIDGEDVQRDVPHRIVHRIDSESSDLRITILNSSGDKLRNLTLWPRR